VEAHGSAAARFNSPSRVRRFDGGPSSTRRILAANSRFMASVKALFDTMVAWAPGSTANTVGARPVPFLSVDLLPFVARRRNKVKNR
jgi:hypothetical protein